MYKNLIKTTFRISKTGLLVGFLFVSTGCSLLPDALTFGDNKLTDENSKSMRSESRQKVGTEKAVQLTRELESAVKEWETLKPSINRLVNLENDLEYLLVQLSDTNSTPMLALSESTISADLDTAAPTIELAKAVPLLDLKPTQTAPRGASTALVSPNANRTQFRSPERATNTLQTQNVAMHKFSSDSGPNIIQNVTTRTVQPGQTGKFSSSDDSINSSDNKFSSITGGCHRETSDTLISKKGSEIAIHLASFKSEALAEKSLTEFEQKHREISCNKNPIIKKVLVKNVTYHSVRLGPYDNRNDAEAACRSVLTFQSYCALTDYDGVVL
jgi:hypothetical protein